MENQPFGIGFEGILARRREGVKRNPQMYDA